MEWKIIPQREIEGAKGIKYTYTIIYDDITYDLFTTDRDTNKVECLGQFETKREAINKAHEVEEGLV